MKSKGKVIHLPNRKNLILYSMLNIFLAIIIYLYFWGTYVETLEIKPFPNNDDFQYVREVEIRSVVSDVIGKPIYTINSNQLKDKISTSSKWIKAVHIEKKFPHTLNIWIDEFTPQLCVRTMAKSETDIVRYFAYIDSKYLGEVPQKFDCPIVSYSEDFDIETPDDFFEDSKIFSCMVESEKIISNSFAIQSRFLVREFQINSLSELTLISFDEKAHIFCLQNYQRSLFYFDKALENYPEHTKGKEFMLYEDSVVVK